MHAAYRRTSVLRCAMNGVCLRHSGTHEARGGEAWRASSVLGGDGSVDRQARGEEMLQSIGIEVIVWCINRMVAEEEAWTCRYDIADRKLANQ